MKKFYDILSRLPFLFGTHIMDRRLDGRSDIYMSGFVIAKTHSALLCYAELVKKCCYNSLFVTGFCRTVHLSAVRCWADWCSNYVTCGWCNTQIWRSSKDWLWIVCVFIDCSSHSKFCILRVQVSVENSITLCLNKHANFGKLHFRQAWTNFDNFWWTASAHFKNDMHIQLLLSITLSDP